MSQQDIPFSFSLYQFPDFKIFYRQFLNQEWGGYNSVKKKDVQNFLLYYTLSTKDSSFLILIS